MSTLTSITLIHSFYEVIYLSNDLT